MMNFIRYNNKYTIREIIYDIFYFSTVGFFGGLIGYIFGRYGFRIMYSISVYISEYALRVSGIMEFVD
jgi:hypothetical protein